MVKFMCSSWLGSLGYAALEIFAQVSSQVQRQCFVFQRLSGATAIMNVCLYQNVINKQNLQQTKPIYHLQLYFIGLNPLYTQYLIKIAKFYIYIFTLQCS
ncbi:Hypothetical_protein [Hexamita inflata]|uniref:Hypothetical_protein n=1 Tax=Hexamita inflata TaxID=28002 RepID=A0AA86TFF6_9EUKA|nr:Hypothetical protein HINF_LOCUS2402 [Hexamita inflata]